MAFIKAASVVDILPGKMKEAKISGKNVLVANIEGKYYAIGNICTHMGCRLSGGKLDGNAITCPCHKSMFDIKTGKVLGGPAKNPEPVYKVKAEGDEILVDV